MKRGTDIVKPVPKPDTIAKSLAIGTPADGYYAIHAMNETGGSAEDCTDEEIIEGIKLLAEYEGNFCRNRWRSHRGMRQKTHRNRENPPQRRGGPLHYRARA